MIDVSHPLVIGSTLDAHYPKSGLYYFPKGAYKLQATVASRNELVPIRFRKAFTATRIGCNVTTLGASSTVRLGIYLDDGTGYPGALLLDAGTIDSSTIGAKEIVISQPIPAGQIWVGGAQQGGTPAIVQIVHAGSSTEYGGAVGIDAVATQVSVGFSQTGVTGALPSTFTATPISTLLCVTAFLKVA